jgi:hypothetical protein
MAEIPVENAAKCPRETDAWYRRIWLRVPHHMLLITLDIGRWVNVTFAW